MIDNTTFRVVAGMYPYAAGRFCLYMSNYFLWAGLKKKILIALCKIKKR